MNIVDLLRGDSPVAKSKIGLHDRADVRRSKILKVRIRVGGKLGHMINVPAGTVQLKCPHKSCYKPDGHAPKTHGTQASQRVKGGIRATR